MIPVLSVSDFIEQINGIVAGEFIVEGEVSQYSVSQGKWIFFSLKDERSVLSCFSTVFMMRTPVEDGMKIRVYGYPKIHDKSGKFSFTVQRVEMVGEGALKKAYELLKKKLTAEGFFDESRKRRLPYAPQRIGVIASRDSAAFGDFKKIVYNRWAGVEIIIRHVAVQGQQAVEEIVQAFADFGQSSDEMRPEVLVLVRGGGSLEDLAAFNTEEVVRAVYASPTPVIVGIGHERDVSLAELVADVRASTPSHAAEIVVPDKRDFISALEFELEHAQQTVRHAIEIKQKNIEQSLASLRNRLEQVSDGGKKLVEKFRALTSVLALQVRQKQDAVQFAQRLLAQSDPRQVLRRGYSIVRTASGQLVRRAQQVVAGERIMIELEQGTIAADVSVPGAATQKKLL